MLPWALWQILLQPGTSTPVTLLVRQMGPFLALASSVASWQDGLETDLAESMVSESLP